MEIYRKIFDTISEGYISCDPKGHILMVNRSVEEENRFLSKKEVLKQVTQILKM